MSKTGFLIHVLTYLHQPHHFLCRSIRRQQTWPLDRLVHLNYLGNPLQQWTDEAKDLRTVNICPTCSYTNLWQTSTLQQQSTPLMFSQPQQDKQHKENQFKYSLKCYTSNTASHQHQEKNMTSVLHSLVPSILKTCFKLFKVSDENSWKRTTELT